MQKKISIQEIKEKCSVDYSENLFGITMPPDYQCQFIDKMIKSVNFCEKEAAAISTLQEIEQCHSTASDIEWEISSFHDNLESLRKSIEGVRSWGEAWKAIAKEAIERNPDLLVHFMSDKMLCNVECLLSEEFTQQI